MDIWSVIPYVILIGAVGFLAWRLGGNMLPNVFKGKAKVEAIVFNEYNDKIKVLGIKITRKYLYYGLVQLGKIKAMSKVPFSIVKKEKVFNEKTLKDEDKKTVTNLEGYAFSVASGFLGLWTKIFFIRAEQVKTQGDSYTINSDISLERWSDKFWYSKDLVTHGDIENIVWKDNFKNVLGLVELFPEKLIKFDPQTAHEVTTIKEEYAGQQRLKQGRQSHA